jgi:hypothetical protein
MAANANATKATGTFLVTSMEEDTYNQLDDGRKLTRAGGDQQFRGDIEGEGRVEWLMCYRGDGSARFVGHQLMTCSIGDRKGTFVIEAKGDFDGATSKGEWWIVSGSGTGGLEGIQGVGGFEAASGAKVSFTLEYRLG